MESLIVNRGRAKVQPVSPILFESDDEDNSDVVDSTKSNNKENISENITDLCREGKILKSFQNVLMGIPPPPAFTVPQLDCREILKLWKDNHKYRVILSSGKDKREIARTLEEDGQTTKWPEVLKLDHWDIYYNKSSISEEIESLSLRYKDRYVGVETSSCINALFVKSPTCTTSARKRSKNRGWGHSPGRRLSHLARRRKAFSSASLCSVAGNKNPDKKMIMVEVKKRVNRQKKRNSTKKTNPTPSKHTKTDTFKRALFQSPDQHPVNKESQTPSSHCIQRSKRNLFVDCSTEKKNENGKRERSVVKRISPRKRVNRSLSFHENTQPVPPITQSVVAMPVQTVLTGAHKQKMLWAATNALREEGMRMGHELFRACLSVLFKACQKLWLTKLSLQKQEGSTSENMLVLTKQFSAYTIKELSSDPTSEHMILVGINIVKMAEKMLSHSKHDNNVQLSCSLPFNVTNKESKHLNSENNKETIHIDTTNYKKQLVNKNNKTNHSESLKDSRHKSRQPKRGHDGSLLTSQTVQDCNQSEPVLDNLDSTGPCLHILNPSTNSSEENVYFGTTVDNKSVTIENAHLNDINKTQEMSNIIREHESDQANPTCGGENANNLGISVLPKSISVQDKPYHLNSLEQSYTSKIISETNNINTVNCNGSPSRSKMSNDTGVLTSPVTRSKTISLSAVIRSFDNKHNDLNMNTNISNSSYSVQNTSVIDAINTEETIGSSLTQVQQTAEENKYCPKLLCDTATNSILWNVNCLSPLTRVSPQKLCGITRKTSYDQTGKSIASTKSNIENKIIRSFKINKQKYSLFVTSPNTQPKKIFLNKENVENYQNTNCRGCNVDSVLNTSEINLSDSNNPENIPLPTSQIKLSCTSKRNSCNNKTSNSEVSLISTESFESCDKEKPEKEISERKDVSCVISSVCQYFKNSEKRNMEVTQKYQEENYIDDSLGNGDSHVLFPEKIDVHLKLNTQSCLNNKDYINENKNTCTLPFLNKDNDYSSVVMSKHKESLSQKPCNRSEQEASSDSDVFIHNEQVNNQTLINEKNKICSSQVNTFSVEHFPSNKVFNGESNNRTLQLYRLSSSRSEFVQTDNVTPVVVYADPPKLVPHWEQEYESEETSKSSGSPPSLVPHWEYSSCSGTNTSLPDSIMTHWQQISSSVNTTDKIMFDCEDTSYEITLPSSAYDDSRASSMCAPFDYPHLIDDSKNSFNIDLRRSSSESCDL